MKLSRAPFVLPLVFSTLFAASWVWGAAGSSRPEVETRLAGGRVHYLVNRGGNIAVLSSGEGALMIDAQFAEVAQENEAAVRELVAAGPVYLVNTHWHGDHTGGNEHFGGMARIFAHTNVRRRLVGDEEIGGRIKTDTPAAALPVLTYADGIKIYFGGEEVRLIHAPSAHTDGDTIVHFVESKVIHMGDTYFQSGYPFIDLDSGGSVQGVIDAVTSVLEWAPEGALFLPGHGEASRVDEVREYLVMVETISAAVRAGAKEGLSADDLLAAGVTEAFDERWDGGFIDARKFVETILRDGER